MTKANDTKLSRENAALRRRLARNEQELKQEKDASTFLRRELLRVERENQALTERLASVHHAIGSKIGVPPGWDVVAVMPHEA